jgi:hypothetical protein
MTGADVAHPCMSTLLFAPEQTDAWVLTDVRFTPRGAELHYVVGQSHVYVPKSAGKA